MPSAKPRVVAVVEEMKCAYLRAVYAEEAARIYSHAKALGEPILIGEGK
jgi:ribulose-5-phosphate 4-epimerase/fuculose-1-phosphate aldolase